MLDINLIREYPDKIRIGISKKNFNPNMVDEFILVDKEWRKAETNIQSLRKEQKEASRDRTNIEKAKSIKINIQKQETLLKDLEEKRHNLLFAIPNIPFDDVTVGKDENENVCLRKEGIIPTHNFDVKDHLELGVKLDIIDTKKASEVSGARFYYLKNEGAILELSLVRFVIDILMQEDFIPIIPPVMIREDVYEKMGRLAYDQKDERYHLVKDDLYLIGSAEHTLGPIQMNETLAEDDLPKRYAGFSTCFRREAGSYGKDTKGILRVHQFDKVEMYSFSDPKFSEKEHKFLLSMQERIYKKLEIPYQVVENCTGDIGFTDARQFDIEAWIPSQKKYREISSCSNTTDYQTRGINAKMQSKDGSKVFLHALNATGVAISRIIIAIIENNQQEDGSIKIPKALHDYTRFKLIKNKDI